MIPAVEKFFFCIDTTIEIKIFKGVIVIFSVSYYSTKDFKSIVVNRALAYLSK